MKFYIILQVLFLVLCADAGFVVIDDVIWKYTDKESGISIMDNSLFDNNEKNPACIPASRADEIFIPPEIDGKKVYEIGACAFQTPVIGDRKTIRIPKTVERISSASFLGESSPYRFGTYGTAMYYYKCWQGSLVFEGDCPLVDGVKVGETIYKYELSEGARYIGTLGPDAGTVAFREPFEDITCYIVDDAYGWDTNKLWYGAHVVVGAIRPKIIVDEDNVCLVRLETGKVNADIYYTIDGTMATTNSFRYVKPIELTKTTTIRAIAKAIGYPYQVESFRYCVLSVCNPIISDGCLFASTFYTVDISCATDSSTIYYTLDGTEPSATNGRIYTGPFDIYQTTTVKAIAVKDDWKDSAVVSATFTKENTIGPAINLLEMLPDNDKTHPWEVVTDVTHDGVSAVKSGTIKDEESTTLKAVIYGAGRLSFWWRTSCEPSIDGEYYDFATFFNGTTEIARLAGVSDWQQVTLNVSGTGKHTFKWTYQKDDSGSTVPDGVWLDQVQWLPQTDDYYSTHTLTTETPVPYTWLDKYELGRLTDFETAAKAKSGKTDGAGRELTVEDEYIAGTDPTNMTSHLQAKIEMVDGTPIIKWSPDWNEAGAKTLRDYKVWGKEALDDGNDWEYPTNGLHRFFKVTVEMPK